MIRILTIAALSLAAFGYGSYLSITALSDIPHFAASWHVAGI